MAVVADFAAVVADMIKNGMPATRHPFRRKVLDGKADRIDFAMFAVQTYHRNLWSSRFAAANHARCPYPEIRRGLLGVVIEEELRDDGGPSHAELMLRFAEAVGLPRADVEASRPLPSTRVFIDTIMNLSQGHWLEGVSFRASEIYAPIGSGAWFKMLQETYGFSADACEWWHTHAVADIEHGNIALDAYGRYAHEENEQRLALAALERMLAAWWVFDDGILKGAEEARQGADVGFPIPSDWR